MKGKRKLIIASGYFNPVHSGHISHFKDAKKLGDRLVVIVNNDAQVKVKGRFPFMNEKERRDIVASIKYVDLVYSSIDKDRSVSKTIKEVHSLLKKDYSYFIFANGGGRKKADLPEYKICEKLDIKMVFGVGGRKKQSSSWLIQNAQKCKTHNEALKYCNKCLEKKNNSHHLLK